MAQQFLTVYDRLGRPVQAKTLVDAYGNDVINPATRFTLRVPANDISIIEPSVKAG